MKLFTRQEHVIAGFIANTVGLTIAAMETELTYFILFGVVLIMYTHTILLDGGKKEDDLSSQNKNVNHLS